MTSNIDMSKISTKEVLKRCDRFFATQQKSGKIIHRHLLAYCFRPAMKETIEIASSNKPTDKNNVNLVVLQESDDGQTSMIIHNFDIEKDMNEFV